MVLATAIAVVAKLTIVGFLGVYAAVYTAGALYLAVAAYRGPILAAASPHGIGEMETRRGTCRGALIKSQRKMELCAKFINAQSLLTGRRR